MSRIPDIPTEKNVKSKKRLDKKTGQKQNPLNEKKNKRKVIRAKKNFIVIAYDVSDDRRRNKVMKKLLKFGTRINYSVFECLLTDMEYSRLKTDLLKIIDSKEDNVVYYPICLKCYTKITYQVPKKQVFETTKII